MYSIKQGNIQNLFSIDSHTGEIKVSNPVGLDMTNIPTDTVDLIVQVCLSLQLKLPTLFFPDSKTVPLNSIYFTFMFELLFIFHVKASDGKFSAQCIVHITVLDVNNNHPEFEQETYLASLPEDIPVGKHPSTIYNF